jgi:hypothetical protein
MGGFLLLVANHVPVSRLIDLQFVDERHVWKELIVFLGQLLVGGHHFFPFFLHLGELKLTIMFLSFGVENFNVSLISFLLVLV